MTARRSAQLAAGAVVAYVALDVALVFLRPHFSVLHNAESDYGSAGAWGWLMNLNFVLRGVLSLLVVYTLAATAPRRRLLPNALVLLSVWAVASALLAFFPDDPVGTKTHGLARVHLVLAAVAFIAVVLGTRLATRALRGESSWRPVAPLLTALSWGALVPVLLLGRAHLRPHSLGGLWEKIFLGIELAWLLTVALWIGRPRSEPAGAPESAAVSA